MIQKKHLLAILEEIVDLYNETWELTLDGIHPDWWGVCLRMRLLAERTIERVKNEQSKKSQFKA